MSIDTFFTQMQYTQEIRDFLQEMKRKLLERDPLDGVHIVCLDELYGLLPPTRMYWHTQESGNPNIALQIKNRSLDGVLEITNDWDRQRMVFWGVGNHFHCVSLELYGKVLAPPQEGILNATAYEELFRESGQRLELLAGAFGNLLLRYPTIRAYFNQYLNNNLHDDRLGLATELMITLMGLKLTPEEELNQDLFHQRAQNHFAAIIRHRSEFCSSREEQRFAGVIALSGCYELQSDFSASVYMMWGLLANEKYMRSEPEKSRLRYLVTEKYYPDGKVEIGDVLPVAANEEFSFQQYRRFDCYRQIYSDLKTAQLCRKLATNILHPVHN